MIWALLEEMARAWFRKAAHEGGNELMLDGKPGTNDPTKFRQGTYDAGGYFGAFSGDWLKQGVRSDTPLGTERYEKVLVSLKPDDDPEARPFLNDQPGGAFEIRCQKPGTTEDRDNIFGLRTTWQHHEIFGHKVATRHPDGSVTWHRGIGGGAASQTRFYSDDRRYCFNVQGDGGGKIVQYDTHGSADETTWTPVGQFKAGPLA